MDSKFVESIPAVIDKVFKTMILMSPAAEPPTDKPTGVLYDITAVVGFTGSVSGNISIQFKSALALKVTASLLQAQVTEMNSDVNDAVGEISNIISGGIKTELARRGVHFDIALPTVVMGQGLSIGHIPGSEVLFFPFTVENEPFVVAVSVKK